MMTEFDCEFEMKYKKKSKLDSSALNKMSNEELIDKIIQLEAYNTQLKNLLQKKCEGENSSLHQINVKTSNYKSGSKRHVLLKLYYLGWEHQGFVVQNDTCNTIEFYLFKALERCCLIENRETSNYQRCGRTDKGVSAFCQVISIDLKSKFEQPTAENSADELPYLTMLNRLLPDNIKCYAWAHVDSNISARFDCSARCYHYYFPQGDLNVSLMEEGAKHLVGEHDFRNLCKMDVGNGVTKFIRNITDVVIKPCCIDPDKNEYSMYKLIIKGNGFLWHQIRCIMAVLILIGQGKESPDIVKQLLDVVKNPSKPQYHMADYVPLTLFDTDFANVDLKWNTNDRELLHIIQLLQKQWTFHSVKNVMIKDMVDELSKLTKEPIVKHQAQPLIGYKESKVYKPLLSRMTCASLEDRIEHYVKKRKLIKDDGNADQT